MFEVEVGKLFVGKKFDGLYCGKTNLSDKEYKEIGVELIKDYDSFINFMNDFNVTLNCNEYKMKNLELSAKTHIDDESALGELIWKYIDECVEEYATIEEEDIKFIKNNYSLIWNSVSSKYVDMVKNCITKNEALEEDDMYSALDEMINAIDRVLIKSLGYYHVGDGIWCKYSTLGKMIWNMFMMYDYKFEDIAYIFEDDKLYDSCMEKLGRNAVKLETHNSYDFYISITEALCREGLNNYTTWSEDNYENVKKYISDELYVGMIEVMDKMIISNLLHLVMFSCKNSRWKAIDYVEDYYLNILNMALEGYIGCSVEPLNPSEDDKVNLIFPLVDDFNSYKPIIQVKLKNGSIDSNSITGIYTPYGECNNEEISIMSNGVIKYDICNQIKNKIEALFKYEGYDFEFEISEELNEEDSIETKLNSDYTSSKPSHIINVNFNSNLTVEKCWEENGKQFFHISCAIPYVNNAGDFKLITQLCCMYSKSMDTYAILEDCGSFVGIDVDEFKRNIPIICNEYYKTLQVK